ncbi:hypothetical protein A2U01_0042745, partial [Trifolium medium]|nr:hypothetical protein [Trifolium medium]
FFCFSVSTAGRLTNIRTNGEQKDVKYN